MKVKTTFIVSDIPYFSCFLACSFSFIVYSVVVVCSTLLVLLLVVAQSYYYSLTIVYSRSVSRQSRHTLINTTRIFPSLQACCFWVDSIPVFHRLSLSNLFPPFVPIPSPRNGTVYVMSEWRIDTESINGRLFIRSGITSERNKIRIAIAIGRADASRGEGYSVVFHI